MDLGLFTMPIHPPGRHLAETLEEDRELVLLADQLGFTEGFIGEHITDAAETITSGLIFIAWLLRETERIRLGTGTINLPNHHPAMVAAEVALVDHMAKGRFLFGISPGGLPSDAELFGNLDQDRTAMFVEAIDHILAIWAGAPPYERQGRFWNVSTASTLIPELGQGTIARPYQQPHPPIVVTAVARSRPTAMRRRTPDCWSIRPAKSCGTRLRGSRAGSRSRRTRSAIARIAWFSTSTNAHSRPCRRRSVRSRFRVTGSSMRRSWTRRTCRVFPRST
jgi:alkanesulfonate monooxygenase SsuD/methylene tetrahydromethanopterin reductase-like flavin-dependent oxidoreductase (luciferase family)